MRKLASAEMQYQSHRLRNEICRLASPVEMARVSAHLRNFAVAETIGLVGTLDSHPRLVGGPVFARGKAAFQQARGTVQNPFTHVQPSNLIVGSQGLREYFGSPAAQEYVARVFGMGVMAPRDWPGLGFSHEPRQLNILDNIAEAHSKSTGLVGAFVTTVQAAAMSGQWSGSGVRQHNRSSLTDYIYEHYKNAWRPNASAAYGAARGQLSGQLKEAKACRDEQQVAVTKQRIEILDAQVTVFERDTPNLGDAAKSVMAATAAEDWE